MQILDNPWKVLVTQGKQHSCGTVRLRVEQRERERERLRLRAGGRGRPALVLPEGSLKHSCSVAECLPLPWEAGRWGQVGWAGFQWNVEQAIPGREQPGAGLGNAALCVGQS